MHVVYVVRESAVIYKNMDLDILADLHKFKSWKLILQSSPSVYFMHASMCMVVALDSREQFEGFDSCSVFSRLFVLVCCPESINITARKLGALQMFPR
jgi:hypothetical protein